jgi:hypothetical protein
MSEEPETPAEPLNIHQRMVAVMGSVGKVAKTKKGNGMQYDYISHDTVTSAILPQLVAHGIASYMTVDNHTQDGNTTIVDITRTFVNMDNPSQEIAVSGFGYGIDKQDKGAGKAVSYADKILLLKAFMLETGEDVEADQKTVRKPDPKVSVEALNEFKDWIVEKGMTLTAVDDYLESVRWGSIEKLTGKQVNSIMESTTFYDKVQEHTFK